MEMGAEKSAVGSKSQGELLLSTQEASDVQCWKPPHLRSTNYKTLYSDLNNMLN